MGAKRSVILQIILCILLLDLILYAVLHYLMLYDIPDSLPLSAQDILGLIRMVGCCALALFFGGRTQGQVGHQRILVVCLTIFILIYNIARSISTVLMNVVWGVVPFYSVEHPVRIFICENLLDAKALIAYYLFIIIYLLRTHFPRNANGAEN